MGAISAARRTPTGRWCVPDMTTEAILVGSTDRPALQRLLGDVRAAKVAVIVVYKVDRLTRSLADFAKLVELFDAHGSRSSR